jgi:hypothetical protein
VLKSGFQCEVRKNIVADPANHRGNTLPTDYPIPKRKKADNRICYGDISLPRQKANIPICLKAWLNSTGNQSQQFVALVLYQPTNEKKRLR